MIELLPSGKSEGYEVCADDVALAVISPVAARNRAQAGVLPRRMRRLCP